MNDEGRGRFSRSSSILHPFCFTGHWREGSAMNLIGTLGLAMGSSWVSGINLYAAVATLGLLGRFAHLQLPGDLNVLTSWWVIGVAIALYLIEFFADKIPYLDSAWDAVHTFIRVPAG